MAVDSVGDTVPSLVGGQVPIPAADVIISATGRSLVESLNGEVGMPLLRQRGR